MIQIPMPNVCLHQYAAEKRVGSQAVVELRCELFKGKACPVRGDAYLGCQRFSRWYWGELLKLLSSDFSERLEVEMQVRE